MQNDKKIAARNERYMQYVEKVTPQSHIGKSLLHSFWVGGLTCTIGQGLSDLYSFIFPSLDEQMVGTLMLCTIISIAIFLTGIGVFDRIGRFAGAGAFLPITGFANAMASASMEFKSEGLVLGTETKVFSVVGPVIVNGIVWSTLVGIIYFIIGAII